MLEAVSITGCLLLALDRCIPGYARERAVVIHVRISGGASAVGTSLNAVMALAAASGFRPGARAPAGMRLICLEHAEVLRYVHVLSRASKIVMPPGPPFARSNACSCLCLAIWGACSFANASTTIHACQMQDAFQQAACRQHAAQAHQQAPLLPLPATRRLLICLPLLPL